MGGILDANDDLAAGPVALIVDPNLSLINRNNPTHTAGVTFFGQFLDHDMTFDLTSRLGFPTQPIRSPNARTPFFDLDSVYANGPNGNPELFDAADRSSSASKAVVSTKIYQEIRPTTRRLLVTHAMMKT